VTRVQIAHRIFFNISSDTEHNVIILTKLILVSLFAEKICPFLVPNIGQGMHICLVKFCKTDKYPGFLGKLHTARSLSYVLLKWAIMFP
jgi:hypothetical protein